MLHGPDWADYPSVARFQHVEAPSRLAVDLVAEGDGVEDDPTAFRFDINLVPAPAGTQMTVSAVYPTPDARREAVETYGAYEGLLQTMDRLAESLRAAQY